MHESGREIHNRVALRDRKIVEKIRDPSYAAGSWCSLSCLDESMYRRLTCVIVLILCGLALGCEKRDLSVDGREKERERGAVQSESDEDASNRAEDDQSTDKSSFGEGAASSSESASKPSLAGSSNGSDEASETGNAVDDASKIVWDRCVDGAVAALRCEFPETGGAVLCASDSFLELRLATPDGAQSVHRHLSGARKSVEYCQFTSPHRVDESYTFYEAGQRLMVESHHVNPSSEYAEGSTGQTEWKVSLRRGSDDLQGWSCAKVTANDSLLSDSKAVATRRSAGNTCETLRKPTIARERRKIRETPDVSCGGEPAPEEFIDAVAAGRPGSLTFTANNAERDREKSAEFTTVTMEGDGEPKSSTIRSCRSFLERVRRRSEAAPLGAPPYRIRTNFGLARYDGHVVLDAPARTCRDFCTRESIHGDFIGGSTRALSLVGPILSYSRETAEADAGVPPYHHQNWVSVDLRTMQTAKIDAIIESESVLDALKNDSFLRRRGDLSEKLSSADTLDAALAVLEKEFDAVGGYAFNYYNPSTNLVALRFGFRLDTAGSSKNRMSQLGLWVEPKSEWVAAFQTAREAPEGGFMMSNHDGQWR